MGRPGLIGMAARTAVVAGTATAVSGRVARRQQGRYAEQQAQEGAAAQQQWEAEQYQAQQAAAQQAAMQAPPPPAAPAAAGVDVVAELQKLATLKEQGILSDAEFAAAKAKLLG
ncbi:SHOCT domain-containing protein [Agromyces sp. Q22]|uniref:SHOCT domain-containing protein n=2 Tax=Agromyces kandeliae TaxID=2666141 RepID=A0A6L5R2D2_9MICO|nr:SHOCT domain-containing protein [Agromyces kandeliae]